MRKEPNTRKIGLFMSCGIVVLLIIFAMFLREKFFVNNGRMIVMYFEESINGLNVGSPVVFKGVQIGKVVAIDLIANTEDLEFSIPVYAVIEPRKNVEDESLTARMKVLDELIDKGLRARLTTQSYLTGLLMIELEMLPNTKIEMRHLGETKALEIPTVLSPMGELSRGIQNLPIQKSVEEFNNFFSGLNNEVPKILPKINQIISRLNGAISPNSGGSADTITNLNRTLNSVGEAARSLRNLTDYLEQHPEALLKGKTGAK